LDECLINQLAKAEAFRLQFTTSMFDFVTNAKELNDEAGEAFKSGYDKLVMIKRLFVEAKADIESGRALNATATKSAQKLEIKYEDMHRDQNDLCRNLIKTSRTALSSGILKWAI
jgi:hypothetical protein